MEARTQVKEDFLSAHIMQRALERKLWIQVLNPLGSRELWDLEPGVTFSGTPFLNLG